MRFEGGRDDGVLPGTQAETLRHLPQVDVGFAASDGSVVQEEVFGKVLLVAVHLWVKQTRGSENTGDDGKRNRKSLSTDLYVLYLFFFLCII